MSRTGSKRGEGTPHQYRCRPLRFGRFLACKELALHVQAVQALGPKAKQLRVSAEAFGKINRRCQRLDVELRRGSQGAIAEEEGGEHCVTASQKVCKDRLGLQHHREGMGWGMHCIKERWRRLLTLCKTNTHQQRVQGQGQPVQAHWSTALNGPRGDHSQSFRSFLQWILLLRTVGLQTVGDSLHSRQWGAKPCIGTNPEAGIRSHGHSIRASQQ